MSVLDSYGGKKKKTHDISNRLGTLRVRKIKIVITATVFSGVIKNDYIKRRITV